MDDIFESSNSEGLMWIVELAIVGTVVELEDEVEDEFGVTDAMEAKLWYHEQRSKEKKKTERNWLRGKKEKEFYYFCNMTNSVTSLSSAMLIYIIIERERERELQLINPY